MASYLRTQGRAPASIMHDILAISPFLLNTTIESGPSAAHSFLLTPCKRREPVVNVLLEVRSQSTSPPLLTFAQALRCA